MFVDIENFKSVLAIENLLIPYKRGRLASDKKSYLPKEPITPDICWEVLRSTNAPRNIENMLQCIAELPPSEQALFKEVVLATFDNREQPDKKPFNIVLLGRKLAAASGYEAELVEAQKLKEGDFLLSASYVDKSFVTFKNSFYDVDFSAYDKVIFLSPQKIEFRKNVKFPKNMEFLNSSDINFDDVIDGCDLQNVQSISFKDGAKLDLWKAQNLPSQLDFSRCAELTLSECDLSNQPNLSFKEGAKVCLDNVRNLPPQLDFSRCDKVILSDCDLYNQPNLFFKEGAKVCLEYVLNLPPQLDFSRCDNVELPYCDFRAVKELTFKNREQMKKSGAQFPDDWKGKIVFADDQQEIQKEENIKEEQTVSVKKEDTPQVIKTSPSRNRWGKFVGKIFGKGGR